MVNKAISAPNTIALKTSAVTKVAVVALFAPCWVLESDLLDLYKPSGGFSTVFTSAYMGEGREPTRRTKCPLAAIS